MKIAIIGFGIDAGQSALTFLKREPQYKKAEFWVLDKKVDAKIPNGVLAQLGDRYLDDLGRFDLIVRSPGVRYHAPEIQAAIKAGVTVTSATKIFFENCPTKNIIGVTGTKGKGTTSTLIYKILKNAGKKVFLAGNIGVPVLSLLPKLNKNSWVVLEMSSFQLMDLTESPRVAVTLMVTSEHLDWHGSVEEYRDAKANIVRFQKKDHFAILAADYPASAGYAKFTKAKIFFFSRRFSGIKKGTFVRDGVFWFSDGKKMEKICATSDLQIPGEHNWENVGATITVARLLKISKAVIAKTVREFKGLEHRLEFVVEKKGVRYYNDSYATTPETTIAAIRAFPNQPKILILGGSSKQSDFRELGKVISKSKSIKAIIGIGVEWPRIKAEIRREARGARREGIKIFEDCKNMKEIMGAVKKVAAPGDVVLLSPACASFGMFKNYSDRGKQFKEWARK
jgi:UDP-N-acetylmuramoylalanine--D-glutamate ligase